MSLPGMTVPYLTGSPPPPHCPVCAESPAKQRSPWGPLRGNIAGYFAERGFRALAECSGCMRILIEVEVLPVGK